MFTKINAKNTTVRPSMKAIVNRNRVNVVQMTRKSVDVALAAQFYPFSQNGLVEIDNLKSCQPFLNSNPRKLDKTVIKILYEGFTGHGFESHQVL